MLGGGAVVSLHYTVAWRFEWVWIDHFSCRTISTCESIATPAKEAKHLGTAIHCMLLYPGFLGAISTLFCKYCQRRADWQQIAVYGNTENVAAISSSVTCRLSKFLQGLELITFRDFQYQIIGSCTWLERQMQSLCQHLPHCLHLFFNCTNMNQQSGACRLIKQQRSTCAAAMT